MTPPVSRSWDEPLVAPVQKSFFSKTADSISLFFRRIFDANGVENEFKDQMERHQEEVKSALDWDKLQIPTHTVESTQLQINKTDDPIERFFEEFLYNIIVSYFESQIIERVRSKISEGVSGIVDQKADAVTLFIIEKLSLEDLQDANTKLLINRAMDRFLSSCSEDDRLVHIKAALTEVGGSETCAQRLADNCTVEEISKVCGKEKISPFVKKLMEPLVKDWLKTQSFKDHLNSSIYENFRTLIDTFLDNAPEFTGDMKKYEDISKISPILKVVAKIGARLVGKRLAFFFKRMNIKEMLDQSISVSRNHVLAHIKAEELSKNVEQKNLKLSTYNDKFAEHKGCHPDAKPNGTMNKALLTKFSDNFVDYILDDKTINDFVGSLLNEREQILHGVTNPFVIGFIDHLIKKENNDELAQALIKLKPLIKQVFFQAVHDIGFDMIFHQKNIFKILYVYIAPAVADSIQRSLIKNIIFNEVEKRNVNFISNLIQLYKNYHENPKSYDFSIISENLQGIYLDQIKSAQNDTIISKLPKIIESTLIEFFEVMKKNKKDPKDLNDQIIKAEIRSYFRKEFTKDERDNYGKLLNMLIFDLSEQHRTVEVAKMLGIDKLEILVDIFTSLFINGVYDLRGVDDKGKPAEGIYPSDVLFKLIEPSIKKYENPVEVRQLFQGANTSWDAATIERETEREAKDFGALLYDLIRSSLPIYGSANVINLAVGGLDKQIVYMLHQLFGRSEINYNLFFHALEILNKQIDVVQQAETK